MSDNRRFTLSIHSFNADCITDCTVLAAYLLGARHSWLESKEEPNTGGLNDLPNVLWHLLQSLSMDLATNWDELASYYGWTDPDGLADWQAVLTYARDLVAALQGNLDKEGGTES